MADTALRSKLVLVDRRLERPADDVLPLGWSVAVLLTLAGASWGLIYLLVSFFL
jgi:hypothetical protein